MSAALAAVALAGKFVLLTNEFKQLLTHIAGGAGFVSNLVLWRESGYFDSASDTKILLHLWSLGIEEQFYLVWPLLLWGLWKLRLKPLGFLAALLLLSFSFNLFIAPTDSVADFYNPLARFWELGVGAIVALVSYRPRFLNACSVIGLLCLLVSMVCFHKTLPFPSFYAALPVLGTALLLTAGKDAFVNRAVLSRRLMVNLGLISYPLYLWHWVLLAMATIITLHHASAPLRAGLMMLAVLLATLTYHGIENPLRFGTHNTRKVFALCGMMIVLGGVGLVGSHLQGVGSRFPRLAQYLPVADFSTVRDWREHTCFLQPEDVERGFDDTICTEQTHKDVVFLWGDSHAAALYPGLKAIQQNQSFDIAQYNASACMPYIRALDDEAKTCAVATQKAMKALERYRPLTVILHGKWAKHYDAVRLTETVAYLRAQGVAHILVIGAVPEWENSLPQSLLAHRLSGGAITDRMMTGLVPSIPLRNQELEHAAQKLGVTYLSAYRLLCNEKGCLTHINGDLTSLDYGHLTPAASRFLMSHVALPAP